MTRPYRNIGYFFLLLFALVIAGFTPAVPGTPFFGYFSTVARSGQVPMVIHLHAIVAMAWFALLCVQPFLIRANRPDLHRLLGWLSLVLVIAFLFTGLQVTKLFYLKGIEQMPRDTVLSLLSQFFTGLVLFTLFYVLALMKRRRVYSHVAFMVAASLAAATPGLARLGLYVVGGLPGILAMVALINLTLVGFIVHARLQYNQPVSKSPFLLVIPMFLLGLVMDLVGSRTPTWLWLADRLTSMW